ncbi:hypothetical protein FB45DRAFT_819589 [Roridomyces roridus]|uniref:XLF-like N-terminal domain-containing protein n=1 Tax=Roridomyces roridus TaxID=1738132 RepID=A0AAD7G259_9AGAR|nr:hypothetical protein FB45DRAFT_819589 [Roridomyces roridus]
MELFSQDHSKLLLGKEWLAKNTDSTPYLFKCYFSTVDLSCFIMMTDTKTVWTEVLNSKQFARRWRACNLGGPDFVREDEEDEWRLNNLQLLSTAHTLGGMEEFTFDCIESNYADLGVELECETFKWRWEVAKEGARLSAELISKHLVLPLISLNHLAFSSAVGESSETDLEKAVDKLGRTTRRSVDTHIKKAMAKPRVATALRRITAMFNSIPELPPILVTVETPELVLQQVPAHTRELSPPPPPAKIKSVSPDPIVIPSKQPSPPVPQNPDPEDSATEDSSEDEAPSCSRERQGSSRSVILSLAASESKTPDSSKSHGRGPRRPPKPLRRAKSPDSDSSPIRPVKKAKAPAPSSDEDSEAERKRHLAKVTSGAGGAKRGAKQPIKRGGKRF